MVEDVRKDPEGDFVRIVVHAVRCFSWGGVCGLGMAQKLTPM